MSACEERGIPYTIKVIDDETPYSAFAEFLQEHIHNGKLDLDGIFCVTDALAHWTRNTLQGMGIHICKETMIA